MIAGEQLADSCRDDWRGRNREFVVFQVITFYTYYISLISCVQLTL